MPDADHDDEDARVPDVYRDTLRHLRRRVQQAVQTIRQLETRNQALEAHNRQLTRQVRELEERPAVKEGEAIVSFEDDPDAIRAEIEGFIATIDRYLEGHTANTDNGETGDDADAPADTADASHTVEHPSH